MSILDHWHHLEKQFSSNNNDDKKFNYFRIVTHSAVLVIVRFSTRLIQETACSLRPISKSNRALSQFTLRRSKTYQALQLVDLSCLKQLSAKQQERVSPCHLRQTVESSSLPICRRYQLSRNILLIRLQDEDERFPPHFTQRYTNVIKFETMRRLWECFAD